MYVIRLHKVLSRLPAVLSAARPRCFYFYRRGLFLQALYLRLFVMQALCTRFMHSGPARGILRFCRRRRGRLCKTGPPEVVPRRFYASVCTIPAIVARAVTPPPRHSPRVSRRPRARRSGRVRSAARPLEPPPRAGPPPAKVKGEPVGVRCPVRRPGPRRRGGSRAPVAVFQKTSSAHVLKNQGTPRRFRS